MRMVAGWSQQTHQPIMIGPITLASSRFKPAPIYNSQLAAVIANQPGALQFADGFGNSGAPYAKH